MTTLEEHLQDPLYANWVKCGKALEITNDVGRQFVLREIQTFHAKITSGIASGTSCASCTIRSADSCQKGICSVIKNGIKKNHRYNNPTFRNTDVGSWLRSPWEIAKCYMPEKNSNCLPSDADFSVTINIIINNLHFSALISFDENNPNDMYYKSKKFRNTVFHPGRLRMSEEYTMENLTILSDILTEIAMPGTADAKEKLKVLMNNKLTLTMEDVTKVQRNALKTLELSQAAINKILQTTQKVNERMRSLLDCLCNDPERRLLSNFIQGSVHALDSLLKTHIQNNEPPHIRKDSCTLESYLERIRHNPEVESLPEVYKEMLYAGNRIDIGEWDLFLFCFVLEMGSQIKIPSSVTSFIDELRKTRDRLLNEPKKFKKEHFRNLYHWLNKPLQREVKSIFEQNDLLHFEDIELHPLFVLLTWKENDEKLKGSQETEPDRQNQTVSNPKDTSLITAASTEEVNRKAKGIVKILKQTAENLKQDEIITLRSKIKEAIGFAQTDQRDEAMIKQALEPHVQMLEFRAGISVNLLKQSVRAFLMITENEQLGKTVHGMFTDYMVEEHPIIGMNLDDELLKIYFKSLEEGSELARHIRLMVVGMYGVGKTTLVNKLLEKETKGDPPSTVSISVKSCEIDDQKKWRITEFKEKSVRYHLRMLDLMQSFQEKRNKHKDEDIGSTASLVKAVGRKPGIIQSFPIDRHEGNDDTSRKEVIYDRASQRSSKIRKIMNIERVPYAYHEGIVVANKNVKINEKKIVNKPTTVSIWDFAGQSVYYSTHHIFLNARAIYLLVLNLSKPLHDPVDEGNNSKGRENLNLGNSTTAHFTQLDAFRFWLKSIYIYTRQKRSTEPPRGKDYKPTIVLIGTHKDVVVERGVTDTDTHLKNHFDEALESFHGDPIMDLIYPEKFFVSDKESPDVFSSLRAEIYKIASNQSFWREKVPGMFLPLEREVEKKKNEDAETMMFDELISVSEQSHYPLSHDEIRLFLRFQHAFGNVLHYEKANPDTVILRPQWIIDAFKLFVTYKSEDCSEEGKDLRNFGKLSEKLINNLLGSSYKWAWFNDKIINYLEHFDIIAKPVRPETSQNVSSRSNEKDRWVVCVPHRKDKENEDFYFMPCMLPTRPSSSEIKLMLGMNGKSSPILCMFIRQVLLPPSVFHRILATCIKEMGVFMYNDKYVLYSSFGAFLIDETTVLTIWTWDNMIYFKITSYHSERETLVPKANLVQIRIYFERLVKRLFDTDGSDYAENIEYSFYVTCPKCPEQFPFDRDTNKDGSPIDQKCKLFQVDPNDLWPRNGRMCNPNRHHIEGRDIILAHWFSSEEESDEKECEENLPLLQDYDDVTLERAFADLADKIYSEQINTLAAELNVSETERGRIKCDHGYPVLNFIFHLLLEGYKSGQTLYKIKIASEKVGCKKGTFNQILLGNDSDQIKDDIDQLERKCNAKHMEQGSIEGRCGREIAGCIGDKYWLLGIRLGITEEKLQLMFIDRSLKVAKQNILQILIDWRKLCGEKTNEEALRELLRAMAKCRCNMQKVEKVLGKP